MAVYFVQGQLGSGKTLMVIKRIQKALNQGRKIATNIDLYIEYLVNPWAKNTYVLRFPDKPSADDFHALPLGYEGELNEKRNGLLVLDECALWFNSRNWNDKGRSSILDWIVHARKRRWDVYFLIQDVEVMDKQCRELFCEMLVTMKRTDKFNIPFIGWIINLFVGLLSDTKFALPKTHLGIVQYGKTSLAPIVERWMVWGKSLYPAYNTEQQFFPPEHPDAVGLCSVLPPYTIYGSRFTRWGHVKNVISNLKVAGRHFFLAGAGLAVLATNAAVTAMPETPKKGFFGCNAAYRELYGSCDAYPVKKDASVSVADKTGKPVGLVAGSDAGVLSGLAPIYVTGSVASNGKYDYFFTCNGRSCDLASLGFQVEPYEWCSAFITKGKFRDLIPCNPFNDAEAPDKPQSVTVNPVGQAVGAVGSLFDSGSS